MRARHALPYALLWCAAACQTGAQRAPDAAGAGAGGDTPTSPVTPGNPLPVGETFNAAHNTPEARAAQLAQQRMERDARWDAQQKARKRPAANAWTRGLELENKQLWKEALDVYAALLVHAPTDARGVEAAEATMRMSFALGEYGEGLTLAEDALPALSDDTARARLHRILGNTYLAIPHWGTTAAGKYIRNQYAQGIPTQTFKEDRAKAIAHLETARVLMVKATAIPNEERLETLFDLSGAVARYTWFDATWQYWWYAWGSGADDGLEEDEGEDEQADESPRRGRGGRHGYYWGWDAQLQRTAPRGMPVTPDGQVIFVPQPKAYDAGLDDTGKLKFILDEIERLDTSKDHTLAARALLTRAMMFRTRDGVERLQRLSNWWWLGANPYKKEVEGAVLHTLKEDEVLGLIATHLGVYRVPEDENVPRLLRTLGQKYPATPSADEGQFLLGTYFQSRRQYDEATRAYEAYLEQRKTGAHTSEAQSALQELKRPELTFLEMGVQPAGRPARLHVRFRNSTGVNVVATRMDLEHVLKDFKAAWSEGGGRPSDRDALSPDNLAYAFTQDHEPWFARYKTQDVVRFSPPLKPDPGGRYADDTLASPIKEPGLWVVEATDVASGTRLARGVYLLEHMAVLHKQVSGSNVTWVVDAVSGQPVAKADVELFEYWSDWAKDREIRHSRTANFKTDDRGVVTQARRDRQTFVTVRSQGRVSYAGNHYFYQGWNGSSEVNRNVSLVVTDRPVYRPGHKVQGKVWVRTMRNGVYAPATSTRNITVRVQDPKGQKLLEETVKADEFGSSTFNLDLKKNAPLGLYSMAIHADGTWTEAGGAQFRVEEYKSPEFTVTVSAAGQARLGDKVPAVIEANYLFGGGVAGAKVHYKVFRQDHDSSYAAPGAWDWLYGVGYGLCFYSYRWFAWWDAVGPHPAIWYPWWGPPPEPAKELVLEGEGRLDAEGKLKVNIDTAPAKAAYANTDHRYTVVAEVTDLSRRLIKGEGSVTVTRNAYFAFVETQRGYWDAGDSVALTITTRLPDGKPHPVTGKVVVEEVIYRGDNGDTFTEEKREEIPVTTDALGPTTVRWRSKSTGQFKFTFVAPDAWGKEVRASTVVWVMGPGFNGRTYRFNGLELITDRREYKVGDTARLLINVNRPGAHVLLGTRAENGVLKTWDVIAMPQKTRVVTIPITAQDVPNFHVEATTVADGSVFQETREFFVPPQDSVLNVSVKADKKEYKPGDKAEITLTATNKDGQPVQADLAVSVFDSAILYIQGDLTPDPRAHFWGRKRTHHMQLESNLTRKFEIYNYHLNPPDLQAVYRLSAAGQRIFQQDVDFRGGGSVRGGVAKDEKQKKNGESERDDAPARQAAAPAALAARAAPEPSADKASAKESKAEGNEEARKRPADATASPGSGPVTVRRQFTDTALFAPSVRTGTDGTAKITVTFPDNLTTWRIKAAGLGRNTQAGQATQDVVSTKKLLIRLEAPRFFRERDRVILSAIVHNKYPGKKNVSVSLDLLDAHLTTQSPKVVKVDVPSLGEKRVDFEVNVSGEGTTTVRMTATADVEGDAKELSFPVLVHGMTKTLSNVGSIPVNAKDGMEKTITVHVPKERRPELSVLTVRYSPTLAGAMLDALPYLLDYPYGCTEQTLSRFIPAVLVKKTLMDHGGLTLEALGNIRANLNPQQLTPKGQQDRGRLEQQYRHFRRHPVFDEDTLQDIIDVGMRRITRMQHGDGGWGWWADDSSSVYTTAYVLMSLKDAQESGLNVDSSMLSRGVAAMRNLTDAHLSWYDKHDYANDTDAYFAWVLARYGERHEKLEKHLWNRRVNLSPYGKLLLALSYHLHKDTQRAQTLLREAEQFLKEDNENETSWLDTDRNAWWRWWQDDIETNAMYVRALDALRPKDPRASRVIKWLLNNRKHGWYWDSTRDTAMTVSALANHMKVSGEGTPDYELDVLWDGHKLKTVRINKDNLFTYDAQVELKGEGLAGGEHTLTFKRRGKGAVYFNTYLSFFTLEEDVKGTGLEIKVDRTYSKLVRNDRQLTNFGDRGQAVQATEVAYRKEPLASGATLQSGDLVQVDLTLTSKNSYDFLAFEDPKPAGMEAVALRSGTTYGEAVANMELRDDKVAFFLGTLSQGQLRLSYRLRAEIPGSFHAMPTHGYGMYAPELQANSDEWRVTIKDAPAPH